MNTSARMQFPWAIVLIACCGIWTQAYAQPHATNRSTVPVVMLSDLHFDPFHDPGKFQALRSAAVSDWVRILSAPASPTQAEDFTNLQKSCSARGTDSSWNLIADSLHAARTQTPKPLFVTVSGDLLAHSFDCRIRTLAPKATDKDVSEFAQKTVAFIAEQVQGAFPGATVFMALGNNDSGCYDYAESLDSDFLHSAGQSFATGVPDAAERKKLLSDFGYQGDYAVMLPSPVQQARLIVLQNLFDSVGYRGCDGKPDGGKAAVAQIAWLRNQLTAARAHHERVWVMAHIPPGIDVYTNFHKYVFNPQMVCEVTSPSSYLNSDALSKTLTDFTDVVKLAIFAHTHMDEMKLLHNNSGGYIPVKLVPSISSVNGNSPSFLVATVNPRTAVMTDYRTFVAQTPEGGNWHESYRFSTTYHLPDYSANSVRQLTMRFAADKAGTSSLSRTYQKWFYPGDVGLFGLGLHQIWPAYACSMVEEAGPAFHKCMCP